MRDIMFRYYSHYADGGIAVDECTLQEIEDGAFKKPFLSGIFARVQYTGLKDANGVMIFEGDIVSGVYTKPTPVEWGECDASIQGSVSDVPLLAFHIGGFPLCLDQDYEVVGNIYQNKDLLAPAGET